VMCSCVAVPGAGGVTEAAVRQDGGLVVSGCRVVRDDVRPGKWELLVMWPELARPVVEEFNYYLV